MGHYSWLAACLLTSFSFFIIFFNSYLVYMGNFHYAILPFFSLRLGRPPGIPFLMLVGTLHILMP